MVVAPMADVTDAAFRRLLAKYSGHRRRNGTIGGPDVMWTEWSVFEDLTVQTPSGPNVTEENWKNNMRE